MEERHHAGYRGTDGADDDWAPGGGRGSAEPAPQEPWVHWYTGRIVGRVG
jgi:hypothetical protein